MKEKMIFTLYRHKYFGPLVVPVMVNDEGKAFYSIIERLTEENFHKYENDLSPVQRDLIRVIFNYGDKKIFKRFTNKKITLWEFFQQLTDDYIQKFIRPFIDKQINKVLPGIAESGLNLYDNLENEKNIYHENHLTINAKPAETVFNFIRNNDGLRYFQTIRHSAKNMKLSDEFALILSIHPCWLLLGQSLYTFDERVDGNKLKPFLSKQYVHIPRNMEGKYFETFIKNSVKHYPVHAEGFEIVDHHPRIKTILSPEKDWQGNFSMRLYFKYGRREVMINTTQRVFVIVSYENDAYKLYRFTRNQAYESEIAEELKKRGLKTSDTIYFSLAKPTEENNKTYSFINWLNEHEQFINQNKIEIDQSYFVQTYFTGSMNISITIEEDNDWFDFQAIVKFGDHSVSFKSLRSHILHYKREYVLPNGELAILPLEWFDKYQDIFAHGEVHKDGLRLQKHHFPLLKKDEYSREKEYAERLEEMNGKPDQFEIPGSLNATLRSYQKQGVQWMNMMTENGFGACLADDMGLGKTLQTLTLLLASKINHTFKTNDTASFASSSPGSQLNLFEQGDGNGTEKSLQKKNTATTSAKCRTSLVVMPASLVHNWYYEIIRFSPQLSTFIHTGNNRTTNIHLFHNYDIVLTTYGIVRNDISLITKFPFHFVVLDESQVIKNPESKSHEAICKLQATYRLTLTGTPIENSLVDMWSQMQFLNPNMLGNLSFFKRYYRYPIEKDNDEQRENKLKKLVQPFILRRTKQEVEKDLPPLTEKVYYCDMSEAQQNIYESEKSRIRNYLLETIDDKGMNSSRFIVLRGLMRLRQIANHPVLAFGDTDSDSGKFSEIIFSIESLLQENHKVLIFSSFVKHLELFEQHFKQQGWKYGKLTGRSVNREKIIRDFRNKPDVKPFLISLKAGGVGLNLPEADYVFMLDPWWNPAAENQAISRAHRIGQKHNVFVYRFISRETLEEKIIRLQEKKSALAETFVNSSNPLSELTKENLEEIL